MSQPIRPVRKTPSIFPDTTDGLLAKAKALTRMCPDLENWTCAMGFVAYKLAPAAGQVQEEALDAYMDWLAGVKWELEEIGESREGFEQPISAERIARLMALVVEHLYSLGGEA